MGKYVRLLGALPRTGLKEAGEGEGICGEMGRGEA